MANGNNVEVFAYLSNGVGFNIVFLSLNSDCIVNLNSSNNNRTYSLNSYTVIDNVTYYYRGMQITTSGAVSLIPYISQEIYTTPSSAIQYYINNRSSINYESISFDLPAGNIAYIKVPDELFIYHLTETMRELSPLFGSGWSDVYQYVGIASSLPQPGDTIILPEDSDLSIFRRINWKKGENTNFFGQTKDAWSSNSIQGENGYFVIYNPAYYYSVKDNATAYWNSNIHIEVNKAADVYVFSVDDGTFNVPPSIGDYEGIYTPDGWINSDGDPILPPEVGGGNYVPSGDDEDSVLNGLISRIERIFSGLWSHIKRIVDSLGEVPSQFGQLLQWLPEDMTSIIISLFSIIIIVGVLKVLL